jgi:hypothetical protein
MASTAKGVRRVAAALALAAACTAGASAAVLPTLYVDYSTNCTFTILDDSGRQISQIAPGTYQVQLNEPQPLIANGSPTPSGPACNGLAAFQLTGPGVTLTTSIDNGDGVNLFTETFQAGATYTAVDNNQPTVARVVFSTLAAGAPSTPPVPYSSVASGKGTTSNTTVIGQQTKTKTAGTPVVFRGALDAGVSAAGKTSLRFKGKPVTSLKAGRYTIQVVDSSKNGGFVLQEAGQSSITVAPAPYVGKRHTSVTLRAGQWFFYPTFVGAKTYFLVTTR